MSTLTSVDYNSLVENITIVSRTDLKGIITYANENFCKISGYTKEELLGQNHNIVRHPSVDPSVYKNMWNTISENKIWHGVLKNINKQGAIYFVKSTIFPILNKDNEKEGYMAIRYLVTDDEELKMNLKKKIFLAKSEKIQQSRLLIESELKQRSLIKLEFSTKYSHYIKELEQENKKLKSTKRHDASKITSLEKEMKEKNNLIDGNNKSNKLLADEVEKEHLKLNKENDHYKNSVTTLTKKLQHTQDNIVTLQGYIDEYRKKIEDLHDVIKSYETEKSKESTAK
mgnify:CR=1 FL=1